MQESLMRKVTIGPWINQLTRNHISVEKLSTWLNIGKGTANLLIQYAKEDMELLQPFAKIMTLVRNSDE